MSWENFLSILLGSLLTILGGFIEQRFSQKKKIQNNKRIEKMNIIKEIIGTKNAIAGSQANENIKARFNSALNLIPVIFYENEKIIKQHDKLYRAIKNGMNADENLYDLVVLLFKDVGLKEPTYEQFIKTLIV